MGEVGYRIDGPEARENLFWLWNGKGDMHQPLTSRGSGTVALSCWPMLGCRLSPTGLRHELRCPSS